MMMKTMKRVRVAAAVAAKIKTVVQETVMKASEIN
jgi:hypothetical protein